MVTIITERPYQTTDLFLVSFFLHHGISPNVSYIGQTVVFSYPEWSADSLFQEKLKEYNSGTSKEVNLPRIKQIYDSLRKQVSDHLKFDKEVTL